MLDLLSDRQTVMALGALAAIVFIPGSFFLLDALCVWGAELWGRYVLCRSIKGVDDTETNPT